MRLPAALLTVGPRARIVGAPAFALLLAGCVLGGDCPATSTAEWRDASLFRALPPAADRAGIAFETEDAGPGLAFSNADLDAQWPGFALTSVEHGIAASPLLEVATSARKAGVVTVRVRANVTDAQVTEAFRGFLADAGVAGDPRMGEWEAELLESREDSGAMRGNDGEWVTFEWNHEVEVPAALDFSAPFERAGGVDARWESSIGRAVARASGWTFTFTLPKLVVTHGDPATRIRADADGNAEVRAESVLGDAAEATLRARADAALDALGLPRPGESWRFTGTVVC